MRARVFTLWIFSFLLMGPAAKAAPATEENLSRKSLQEMESRPLYQGVPDIEVTLPQGQKIKLSDLWGQKPLLITLFYRNCTGSCSPFLHSLDSTVTKVGGLGSDYQIISLSFDPEDTAEDLGKFAGTLGLDQNPNWLFGTADPAAIRALADAIGFWYKLEPQSGQYDHPTLLAAVRDGKIRRVLLGNVILQDRFQELVREVRGEFIPFYSRPGQKTVFRCVEWNPSSKSLWPHWGLLFLVFPGVAALGMAVLIFQKFHDPTSS